MSLQKKFGLTQSERAERDRLLDELEQHKQALTDALAEFKQKTQDLWNQLVQDAVDELQASVDDWGTFHDDIVQKYENRWDDLSERAQESDDGQTAQAWLEEWRDNPLDGVALPEFDIDDAVADLDDFDLPDLPAEVDW